MTISEEMRERIDAELRNINEYDMMTDGEYIDAIADAVGSGASGTLHERLADLVEPQLPESVEWPRFEDGELVKVGNEVEYEGETMRVYLATFDADGWALWCSRDGIDGRLSGSFGERVKRPTRKVLDADGVPIKVDDVVYFVGGSGVKYAVKDIGFEPDGAFVDIIDEEGRYSTMVNTEKLTHERPDSWERLEEDAAKRVCEYAGAQKSIADDDKYSCINCPYDEPGTHTDKGCQERMRLDLVRRAKKLAKAGEVE